MTFRFKTTNTVIFCVFALLAALPSSHADSWKSKRLAMVGEIEADVRDTSRFLGKNKLDNNVLKALKKVQRHEFVPPQLQKSAYQNRPLPIGFGQTISQPYIVAIMTDLLALKQTDRVLEIGTGSGYQAAILGEVVDKVFTIEIIEELGKIAAERLEKLGYRNIRAKIGDGYYGWPGEAPFDSIVVTAAASHIPPPLLKQLKPGGRMIIPVGSRFMVQQLVLLEKTKDDSFKTRQLLPVRFVPLTGGQP